jgi:hypothetical protein
MAHSQAIRHELPVVHAKRHRRYQSHDPADQRQSSSTLIKPERSIDDLDAFRLKVNGSEDRRAHDADCEDNRFCEEEPDGPGHHRRDKRPYAGHLARFVAGEFMKPCDFARTLQTAVQYHARPAFLREPEPNENNRESYRSKVKHPSPANHQHCPPNPLNISNIPTQPRSRNIHSHRRPHRNPNNRPLNPKINRPDPLPDIP